MDTFIGGMAIAGIGAGICELTALAATSELAPTQKRGKYVAVLVFTILPYCPSVLWVLQTTMATTSMTDPINATYRRPIRSDTEPTNGQTAARARR
jgi:MFS family permease